VVTLKLGIDVLLSSTGARVSLPEALKNRITLTEILAIFHLANAVFPSVRTNVCRKKHISLLLSSFE
jgi:hypothetical protein